MVLIVGGLVYGYLAQGLPVRSLPNTPGPSFFPYVITAVLLALSVGLLVQALASKRDPEAPGSGGATDKPDEGRRLALLSLGALIAYAALLPFLGFIVATVPFFAFLMVLFSERRPLVVAITACAATVILYALFRYGFGVFLPRGILQGIVA